MTDWLFPTRSENFPDGYLSPNTVKQWRVCARCLFADKVLHQPRPVRADLAIGVAVHRGAEHIGRTILGQPGYAVETAIDAGVEAFESAADGVDDRPREDQGGVGERMPLRGPERDKAKNEAVRLLRYAVPEFARLYGEREIVDVEVGLDQSRNPFPFPVVGRKDAVFAGGSSDIKTASARGVGENDCLQAGVYLLFEEPGHQFVFDVLVKTKAPYLARYAVRYGPATRIAWYDHVLEIAEDIRDGFAAYLDRDWRTVNRCFPIGQGFYGRHDVDHNLGETEEVFQVSFAGCAT